VAIYPLMRITCYKKLCLNWNNPWQLLMRLQFRYILPRWLTEQVDEDCVEVLVEPLQATQLTAKMVRSFLGDDEGLWYCFEAYECYTG